jgi:hypothetical protein
LAQPEREKECYVRDCPGESSLEYPNHDGMNDMGKDLNIAGYMWRTGPWGEVSHITKYSSDAFMTSHFSQKNLPCYIFDFNCGMF